MGCGPSKPAASKPRDSLGGGPAAAARPDARGAAGAALKPAGGPIVSAAAYDSKSSASLSTDGAAAPVAFYGILAANSGAAKLSLANRVSSSAPDRLRVTAVHIADDSAAPRAAPRLAAPPPALVSMRGYAMTLPYTVHVGAVPPSAEPKLRALVDDVFARVNDHLNAWNPESDIAALNQAAPMKPVPVSSLLADVFSIVDQLHDVSGARFDPTAGVLSLAWTRSIADHSRPPLPADVSHLRHAIGWPTKVRRKDKTKAARANANTVVDIDGVVKGHAVDMLFAALCETAHALTDGAEPDVYVDWAGDICCTGRHPAARPWRTAVMRPPGLQDLFKIWGEGKLHDCLAGADPAYIVDLVHPRVADAAAKGDGGDHVGGVRTNSAVSAFGNTAATKKGLAIATSGDYFQMQKFGFHHVANPVDVSVMKAGAISVASVSVLGSSCAIVDGLATAAMTFVRPSDAASFLEAIIRRRPNDVFGYAVVGRTPDHKTEMFTSSFFDQSSTTPSVTKANTGVDPDLALSAANSALLREAETNLILSRCPRIPCLLKFDDANAVIQIDSLQSLSMDPEPCVSFTFPSSLRDSFGSSEQKGVVYFAVGKDDAASSAKPASLSVQVIKTISVNDSVSVAIAAVCDATQGTASTIGLQYASHSVSFALTRAVEPTVFTQMTLVEQAKAVLRRVPGIVWIVVTEAAHGGKHAVTASSVASSVSAPDVVSFNIMSSNVFTAAFRGVGSTVQIFGLDASQEHLASKFVEKSTMTDGDFEGLRHGANLCLDVNIIKVAVVTDHMLAVGQVRGASSLGTPASGEKSPLVWLDRRYERLTI